MQSYSQLQESNTRWRPKCFHEQIRKASEHPVSKSEQNSDVVPAVATAFDREYDSLPRNVKRFRTEFAQMVSEWCMPHVVISKNPIFQNLSSKNIRRAIVLVAAACLSSCCKCPPPPPPPPPCPQVTEVPPPPPDTAKKKSAKPASLAQIQTELNKHGAKLKADGKPGPKTTLALQKFQKQNHLKVTGKADKATRAKRGVG